MYFVPLAGVFIAKIAIINIAKRDLESRIVNDQLVHDRNKKLVGVKGFEPSTPCTPCKCATRLRHTPNR